MIEKRLIVEPIEVDRLPTGLLLTFLEHHQRRITELQNELITRVKLHTMEEAEKDDEPAK
jgi:hypothetical protein